METGIECSVCGKVCVDENSLRKHTNVHLRRNECEVCGKIIADFSNFRKHCRIHTGEKSYCCDKCGKRFSDHSGYAVHHKIHTREKKPTSAGRYLVGLPDQRCYED